MSKKVEVTKIVIRMGDKDAELTIEQARELKDALDSLLGTKGETVYVPHPYPYPVPQPYPYYWRKRYWIGEVDWNTYTTISGTTTDRPTGTTVTYSLNTGSQ